MTATEYVVLGDEHDQETCRMEKLAAHEMGAMHRAFSIFIFQDQISPLTLESRLLLQQRALDKYHSPGLWTNTCCSHPRSDENILAAGNRRLQEEMGFSTPLSDQGYFHYTAQFDNGLIENEIDHVLLGAISGTFHFQFNPAEVATTRWITLGDLRNEIIQSPATFTPWLLLALRKIASDIFA